MTHRLHVIPAALLLLAACRADLPAPPPLETPTHTDAPHDLPTPDVPEAAPRPDDAPTVTDPPMIPALPDDPAWAEACKVAQAYLGDEPIRTCKALGAPNATTPWLLHLRTDAHERRLLVHGGAVITDTGPDALAAYLHALDFPRVAPPLPILWDLLHLFEVLPEDWRFRFVPEGRWADAEAWMRAATLYYDSASPPVELTHTADGATLLIHRVLHANARPPRGAARGTGGVGKDQHRRLTVTFDAQGRLLKTLAEFHENHKWQRVK